MARVMRSVFTDTVRGAGALSGITPSCSHFRQLRSNSAVGVPCAFLGTDAPSG
jgi:hypothetical protein